MMIRVTSGLPEIDKLTIHDITLLLVTVDGATEEPDQSSLHHSVHKVHIFTEYHSLCPLAGIGTLPPRLSPASVPLPPEPKGAHSQAGEGLGESQFRLLEKKLSTLPTLFFGGMPRGQTPRPDSVASPY